MTNTAENRSRDLFLRLLRGKGTEEEEEEYKTRYMDDEEKLMGKPVYKMTDSEFEEYKVLQENLKWGTLKNGSCNLCRNKGYMMARDGNYTVMRICECIEQRKRNEQVHSSEYAELLLRNTFERFQIKSPWQKDLLRRAKIWTQQKTYPFLFLGGKTGTGKTHLAVAAFYRLYQRGYGAKFVSWRTESRDLKMRMSDYGFYEPKLKELKEIPLLLLDDFLWGANGAMPSDEDFRLAKEIIDARSSKRLLTIITSNFTIRALTELSEELGGRIYEACGSAKNFALTVSQDAENFRLKSAPTLVEIANDETNPFD